jgi:calcium-dependent protein kinase
VLKGRYTEKVDVWSCGIMLYVLLWGCLPFSGENEKEVFHAI